MAGTLTSRDDEEVSPRPYSAEDDARRTDLADALAVVVSLPPMREEEVGRVGELSLGGVFATYGYGPGTPEGALASEFLRSTAALVGEAMAPLEAFGACARPEARRYDIGPAAGGLPDVIFATLQDARPYLDDGVFLFNVGQAVVFCLKGFQKLTERIGVRFHRQGSPLVFTEPMILGLCYAHVRETYHPRASVKMESHVRSDFPGYGDPEHPGGMEHYLIRAKVGRRTYVYALDSHAIVADHYLLEGGNLTMLPLPNWTEASFLRREHGRPVRSVVVEPRRLGPGTETD